MVIFRPHRRLLDEALAEAKEFRSICAMKQYIVSTYTVGVEDDKGKIHYVKLLNYKDLIINKDSVIDDERCGWHNSMYVCTKRIGDEVFAFPQCIGMCATKYERGVVKNGR